MRRNYTERIKKYISNHERYKKWLVIILVLAIIAGTGTFYALNKPATAVSEETADEVGMSLNDEDDEEEEEVEEDEQDDSDDEDSEDEDSEEDSDDESGDGEDEGNGSEEGSAEISESEESGDSSSEEGNESSGEEEASDDDEAAEAVSENEAETVTSESESVSENEADEEADTEDSTVSEDSVSANKTEYEYSDSKIKITAKLTEASAIPDDAELVVTELTADTDGYNYDAYMDALNNNADSIAEESGQESAGSYNSTNTLMYDIAFMSEGTEVQPAEGTLTIKAEFKKNQLSEELAVENTEDVTVVHLPIKEEVKESEEITVTQEATSISSDDIEVKTLADSVAELADTETVEFSADSFSIYAITVYQPHVAGTDTFETVLGDAVNFGITANTFSLGGDSQTNFAAGHVSSATSQTGNNLTNEAEQTFMIGSIASGYTLNYRGGSYPAYFLIPFAYSSQLKNSGNSNTYFKVDTSYSSDEIKTDVSDMISYAKDASEDLASRDATLTLTESNQKYYIDIRDREDGTYYINMNATAMENIAQADKLRIYKNDGQTIVFNVTSSKTINLYKYSVNGVGTDSMTGSNSYSTVAQTIIWNFTKATTINAYGSVVGTFIAPTSVWNNYATSAGWLVAKTAYIYGGEWHNIYTGVKQISGTAVFEAYKTIDGAYAATNGFKFTLYEKSNGEWKEVETVENDGHNVSFSPITFDETNTNLSRVGDSEDFVYKIAETAGANDSDGNAYIADTSVYYAKVSVKLNNNGANYYTVSEPVYYTDEDCTKQYTDEDRPVFNNKSGNGSVTLSLYKYLNGGDPGEHTYSFTVKVLKTDGTLETLTDSLKNSGKNIAYTAQIVSDYVVASHVYFVITENDLSDTTVEKDDSIILVRVDDIGTDSQSQLCCVVPSESVDSRISSNYQVLLDDSHPSKTGCITALFKRTALYKTGTEVAFYNEGIGNLRIHKMVVNDFGSKMVRNATGTALLSNVKFRVTNNETGNYIVFTGFTDVIGTKTNWATEYYGSANNEGIHEETGSYYDVAYNRNAQWTLIGIPAGTYTVEEVADGLTFSYDALANTSTAIDDAQFCRVTKYDLTVDTEGVDAIGTGGDNYRKVFSVDLENHQNTGPTNVKVGDETVDNTSHTQTVQVCNYYSIPVGPVVINKNFNSKDWDSDLIFSFNIEPVRYTAYDSEGNSVELDSEPMPDITTATVSYNDATKNGGTWTAVASFGSIAYRYEGVYVYKITEVDDGLDGITYDDGSYYIQITVSKKYTTFSKEYSYENMTNPEKYTSDTTLDEDFYYLGGDILYSKSDDFTDANIIAKESLYLGTNPDTSTNYNNKFIEDWDEDYSDGAPAFENTRTASLKVNKVWLDKEGNDESPSHTTPLLLEIWQKSSSNGWQPYIVSGNRTVCTVELNSTNDWSAEVSDLPIYDEDDNEYVYCVSENSVYSRTFYVTYTVIRGYEMGVYTDSGYEMTFDSSSNSYGKVTVTNKDITSYALPSTGGVGEWPYRAAGATGMLIAGIYLYRRRKNRLKS